MDPDHGRTKGPRAGFWPAVLCWTSMWCGCDTPALRSRMALESPDPAVRVSAIVRVAERGDPSALPLLVDRLEDEDEAVRFYAILALERLTGERLGYRYGDSELERRASVECWRRFLAESGTSASAPVGSQRP